MNIKKSHIIKLNKIGWALMLVGNLAALGGIASLINTEINPKLGFLLFFSGLGVSWIGVLFVGDYNQFFNRSPNAKSSSKSNH